MNERLIGQNRSNNIVTISSHILLGILGIYNLFFRGSYFVNTWKSLHAQGVGYLYLIIMIWVTSWWLIAVVSICFMGNFLMPKADDKSGFKSFTIPLLGVVVSVVYPTFMLKGWFIVIVWLRRSFLEIMKMLF